ncbi:MAG: GNAT family N-acetyltransferase [Bacteroidales bacterium]|nr:GNAT family N-acetyltransferase [Bacteroidales bacterium]
MENIKVSGRIVLHPIQLIDASEIFQTIKNQRDYLGRWLPFVATTEEQKDTEAFISSVIETPEDKREHTFVIRYKNTFAGIIGFRGTDRANKKTELGYWLSEHFQGKGIVIQSVKKLIALSFNQLNMNRLVIRCATENYKSKKIPISLNFKFEGIERAGELLSNGKFTDLEVYSLLKRETKI